MSMHEARSSRRAGAATSARTGAGATDRRVPETAAAVLWCVDCGSEEQFDSVEAADAVSSGQARDDTGDTGDSDATAGRDSLDSAAHQLLFVELLCRGCGAASVLGMLAGLPRSTGVRATFARTA